MKRRTSGVRIKALISRLKRVNQEEKKLLQGIENALRVQKGR